MRVAASAATVADGERKRGTARKKKPPQGCTEMVCMRVSPCARVRWCLRAPTATRSSGCCGVVGWWLSRCPLPFSLQWAPERNTLKRKRCEEPCRPRSERSEITQMPKSHLNGRLPAKREERGRSSTLTHVSLRQGNANNSSNNEQEENTAVPTAPPMCVSRAFSHNVSHNHSSAQQQRTHAQRERKRNTHTQTRRQTDRVIAVTCSCTFPRTHTHTGGR